MTGRFGAITLHDELADILRQHGNTWMTTEQLAAEVNRRRRYRKQDGREVTAFQIHGRTRNYSTLFERDGSRVHLRVDIEANLAEYLAPRSPTDRYASFDYCFNYFQGFAEQGREAELAAERSLQESCLQLGFYLASWGMYRGSALRLQRSLAHLVPAVRVIATAPRELWSIDANDYSDEACSLVLDTARRLSAAYPQDASETFTTKVMLGTFGCVPAFDVNFITGSRLRRFDLSALQWLGEFYSSNAEIIEQHRVRTLDFATGADSARRYPRAKVIDMIFFIEGQRAVRAGQPTRA